MTAGTLLGSCTAALGWFADEPNTLLLVRPVVFLEIKRWQTQTTGANRKPDRLPNSADSLTLATATVTGPILFGTTVALLPRGSWGKIALSWRGIHSGGFGGHFQNSSGHLIRAA